MASAFRVDTHRKGDDKKFYKRALHVFMCIRIHDQFEMAQRESLGMEKLLAEISIT